MSAEPVLFLFAEDDDEDWILIQDTFEGSEFKPRVERVRDGVALMARLRAAGAELPDLILLDLKMPLKDGHEALAEIRADNALRHIPVVIMTASRSESDILRSYSQGANSYIAKPVAQGQFKTMSTYWSEVVHLPKVSGD